VKEVSKKMHKEIDTKKEEEIEKIIKGNFMSSAIGTIDEEEYPLVTKTIPMFNNKSIYLLMSDLSDHTKNILKNNKISIYYFLKEEKEQKLNNKRLTFTGTVKKLDLKKNSKEFLYLLESYEKIEIGSKFWGAFSDFNFYKFKPKKLLFIEGFGNAYKKTFN
jgi:putative heme iron utilization protein